MTWTFRALPHVLSVDKARLDTIQKDVRCHTPIRSNNMMNFITIWADRFKYVRIGHILI